MKYLIIALIFFTSCLTEKKVNRWLNEHEQQAAGYCAKKFPPDTLTRTVIENIDSAGYYDAYLNMAGLADSLFTRLDSIEHLPAAERQRLNIDSIRKVVDKEIRKRLKPCIDTVRVVTNTVVDRARERQLLGVIDDKNLIITDQQKTIGGLTDKVHDKNKYVWMFWVLVALAGGYTALKIRGKLPF